jgi:UDP-N-acetylmuramoyl-L-alanyl-D-glutamate--2,6-diaminopimelate ligase
MKTLQQLIQKVKIKESIGDLSVPVSAIEIDSRKVLSGAVFVAIKGVQIDGQVFITKAIHAGAVAIVCETLPDEKVAGICYLLVLQVPMVKRLLLQCYLNYLGSWGIPAD